MSTNNSASFKYSRYSQRPRNLTYTIHVQRITKRLKQDLCALEFCPNEEFSLLLFKFCDKVLIASNKTYIFPLIIHINVVIISLCVLVFSRLAYVDGEFREIHLTHTDQGQRTHTLKLFIGEQVYTLLYNGSDIETTGCVFL